MKHLLLIFCAALMLAACSKTEQSSHADEHGVTSAAEYERGPHRGRMLRDGPFALEVTMFETGVPPEFRLFAYLNDQPLPAKRVEATIALGRLDGEQNHFEFVADGEQLIGQGTVTEPHSFDVVVKAKHDGRAYRWQYASYEGRTSIPAKIAEAAGVQTAVAGPATIHERIRLMGRVAMNGNRFAEVRARFDGPVKDVRVGLGDQVQAGQTLAVIENRESLRTFAVTAPFAGVVLARHTNVGDVAGTEPLFEIADLSSLWVEFNAFGTDVSRLATGQSVRVRSSAGELAAETRLGRMLPLANSASQTVVVRGLLANPDGHWRPGMAVTGEVTVASREVDLAVRRDGLQRFRDFTVVFAHVADTYEVRMLELGQQDDVSVEVLGGLKPGTEYVTEQSFLIKADIEKSGASHDH